MSPRAHFYSLSKLPITTRTAEARSKAASTKPHPLGEWIAWSLAAGLVTVALDLVTSARAFARGGIEQNPFYYVLGPELYILAVFVQPVLSLLVAYGTIRINRRHTSGPLTWKNTVIAFNFPRMLVGILNIFFF